jgi:hypothetical protein
METPASPPLDTALNYATPALTPKAPRLWAAAVLAVTSLGLILLGGCFTIGILLLNESQAGFGPPALGAPPAPKTPGQIVLEIVLYLLAFACFGGAIYLLGLVVNWLRKIAIP